MNTTQQEVAAALSLYGISPDRLSTDSALQLRARYILAVDPGNVQSAYTVLDAHTLRPLTARIVPNEELLQLLSDYPDKDTTSFVIEMVASYGMAVGREVFETVFWIGQLYAAAAPYLSRSRVYRMDVKMNFCHNSRAKDANIRQALIDRFGVVGTKKDPGWFYGFKADCWAAYAVGVTFADKGMERD